MRRPTSITVVAILIALSGAMNLVYAGLMPTPELLVLLGIVDLGVALGIYLLRAWARVAGIALQVLGLAIAIVLAVRAIVVGTSDAASFGYALLSVAVDVLISLAIVWALLRRWPVRT